MSKNLSSCQKKNNPKRAKVSHKSLIKTTSYLEGHNGAERTPLFDKNDVSLALYEVRFKYNHSITDTVNNSRKNTILRDKKLVKCLDLCHFILPCSQLPMTQNQIQHREAINPRQGYLFLSFFIIIQF